MSGSRFRKGCLLVIEGLLALLCGVLAVRIRFADEALEQLTGGWGWLKILLFTLIVQGSFYLFDLYDFQMIRRWSALLPRLVQAVGLAAITLALIFYALPRVMTGRGVFLLSLLLMTLLMTSWRLVARWLLGHPRLVERVLILGTDKNAVELARETLERPEAGYHIVGFVGDDAKLVGKSLLNPCVVGISDELETLIQQHQAERLVVALSDRRGRLPLDALLRLRLSNEIEIEEAESFYERLTGKLSTETLRPAWLIFSGGTRGLRIYQRARRALEVMCALAGLLLAAPLMLLVALAIKLDSRGPVFYTQERVGLHNRLFRIIKFRSMRTDAEAAGPVWAGQSDARVTRVGRIIRKLRIDELPQFINILRGEMSLVGPRPERPVFVAQLAQEIPWYAQRHLVRPGLTGWAQVCFPYGASVEDAMEKHKYDLYYIRNQSPLLDGLIMLETARLVLFGRNAR
jgi:sugar transferase (PEP-CTERM system associated)